VVMRSGRIVESGPPDEVLHHLEGVAR
jgi:ABC-type glutathione transport system ATPase component